MSDRNRSLNSLEDIEFAVKRIEELEAKLARYDDLVADKINLRSENSALKAKLAKAVEALGEAIYLLDPDEEDIAKKTGMYRIVTTYAELTGGNDE